MKITGIYFFIRRRKVVYIGQTTNFCGRMANHRDKKFDAIKIIKCKRSMLSHYESRWIARFNPQYNRDKGPKKPILHRRKGITRMDIALNTHDLPELQRRAKLDERSVQNYIHYLVSLSLRGDPPPTTKEIMFANLRTA